MNSNNLITQTQAEIKPTRVWRLVVAACLIVLIYRESILDWSKVGGDSMQPTLLSGDRVSVNKLAFGLRLPFFDHALWSWALPSRGDVITFMSPDGQRMLVKRVIAVPGDEVRLKHHRLSINGEPAHYLHLDGSDIANDFTLPPGQYLERSMDTIRSIQISTVAPLPLNSHIELTMVPAGKLLVLGDHRNQSWDFRKLGWIDQASVIGRAERVLWSLNADNGLRNARWWLPLRPADS